MTPHVSAIKPTTSVNRDPLTDQFTRGRISNAQLRAGQEFRKLLSIVKEGTDDHRAADEALARSYRALGTDGSALERKFNSNLDGLLAPDARSRLIGLCSTLEKLPHVKAINDIVGAPIAQARTLVAVEATEAR